MYKIKRSKLYTFSHIADGLSWYGSPAAGPVVADQLLPVPWPAGDMGPAGPGGVSGLSIQEKQKAQILHEKVLTFIRVCDTLELLQRR